MLANIAKRYFPTDKDLYIFTYLIAVCSVHVICQRSIGWAANSKVLAKMFQTFVHSFAKIGGSAFPDVLVVIQDDESDASALPCTAMAGDGGNYCVGYSVDMSVDLANASHFDVHDALQGLSVWTEEKPGLASNWHFVMPNLHGISDDGKMFNSVAIKLHQGTAISWDGRFISRHCTSLSYLDGPEGNIVGQGTGNDLYGTSAVAKERIAGSGRTKAALTSGMVSRAASSHAGSAAEERYGHVEVVTVDVPDAPYNPRIKDADPNCFPPPKEGDRITWIRFYRWLRNCNLKETSRLGAADPLMDETYSILRKEQRF